MSEVDSSVRDDESLLDSQTCNFSVNTGKGDVSLGIEDCSTMLNGDINTDAINCVHDRKGPLWYSHRNGLQKHECNGSLENGEVDSRKAIFDQSSLEIVRSSDANVSLEVAKDETSLKLDDENDRESKKVGKPETSELSDSHADCKPRTHSENRTLSSNTNTGSLSLSLQQMDCIETSFENLSVNRDDNSSLKITFVGYESEAQMPEIMALITQDLSEPYSVYTYRYFLHNWPNLSHLAYCNSQCIGAVVCKLDLHQKNVWRGYIAMLVIHKDYRKKKIGSNLVKLAIRKMIEQGCDEVVLETEVTNKAALGLYENLGFVRDKRLLRYYLNGVDAWRLKLWLR